MDGLLTQVIEKHIREIQVEISDLGGGCKHLPQVYGHLVECLKDTRANVTLHDQVHFSIASIE